MRTYSLAHLSDRDLLRGLASLVAQDRATTAVLLAHLAEVDARKLYLPAAYPSLHAYCVHELHLSEDAAAKRIQAARAARRFPAIFDALADGRLHLTAVGLLAPHLTEDTAGELLAAASHQSKAEIERLLAERFPRPEMLAWTAALEPSPTTQPTAQHAPAHVEREAPGLVPGPLAGERAGDRSRVKPLAPQRVAVQFTLSGRGHETLRYAQALLGHQVPSGDLAQVFERALEALVEQLEKTKFAATSRPSRSRRPSTNPRHIPAAVKRAVRERDQGRCTFVSDTGRRCSARERLEYDHVEPVARGGRATVAMIRLRCRAHNQFEAERTFGVEFMHHKREAARCRAEARRKEAAARAAAEARRKEDEARRKAETAQAKAAAAEVIEPLRVLGFRADEARRAAALCESIPDTSLEERVRRALSYFHPRPRAAVPAAIRLESAP